MKFNYNDPKYFIYLDLIGRELYAKSKSNPNWPEFRDVGQVVGETKYVLHLQSQDSIKQFVKKNYIFRCWLPQPNNSTKLLEFNGRKIIGNPEQRIKKIRKKTRRMLH